MTTDLITTTSDLQRLRDLIPREYLPVWDQNQEAVRVTVLQLRSQYPAPPRVRLAGKWEGWDYVWVEHGGVLWQWGQRAGGTIGSRGWELMDARDLETGREAEKGGDGPRRKSLEIAKKAVEAAEEAAPPRVRVRPDPDGGGQEQLRTEAEVIAAPPTSKAEEMRLRARVTENLDVAFDKVETDRDRIAVMAGDRRYWFTWTDRKLDGKLYLRVGLMAANKAAMQHSGMTWITSFGTVEHRADVEERLRLLRKKVDAGAAPTAPEVQEDVSDNDWRVLRKAADDGEPWTELLRKAEILGVDAKFLYELRPNGEADDPKPKTSGGFVTRADGLARGAAAFAEGYSRVPYHDPHLRGPYTVGPVPSNEYIDGWMRGWDDANLAPAPEEREEPEAEPEAQEAEKPWSELFPANSYLNRFFAEKVIPEREFTVTDSQGMDHFIPNGVVVEAIAQTSGAERKKVEDTLRQIDYRNGDVNHYLEHLAKALAEQWYGGAPAPAPAPAAPKVRGADERLYHVVVRNDRTKEDHYLTATPVTHDEAHRIMSKALPSSRRPAHTRIMVKELIEEPPKTPAPAPEAFHEVTVEDFAQASPSPADHKRFAEAIDAAIASNFEAEYTRGGPAGERIFLLVDNDYGQGNDDEEPKPLRYSLFWDVRRVGPGPDKALYLKIAVKAANSAAEAHSGDKMHRLIVEVEPDGIEAEEGAVAAIEKVLEMADRGTPKAPPPAPPTPAPRAPAPAEKPSTQPSTQPWSTPSFDDEKNSTSVTTFYRPGDDDPKGAEYSVRWYGTQEGPEDATDTEPFLAQPLGRDFPTLAVAKKAVEREFAKRNPKLAETGLLDVRERNALRWISLGNTPSPAMLKPPTPKGESIVDKLRRLGLVQGQRELDITAQGEALLQQHGTGPSGHAGLRKLPAAKGRRTRLREAALAGVKGKDWYLDAQREIEIVAKAWGVAPEAVAVAVAATSPATPVVFPRMSKGGGRGSNIGKARAVVKRLVVQGVRGSDALHPLTPGLSRLHEFERCEAEGLPAPTCVQVAFPTPDRVKTHAFVRNLLGETEPVTVDRHLIRTVTMTAKKPKGEVRISANQYEEIVADVRAVARELGWEPRQVMAAVWTAAGGTGELRLATKSERERVGRGAQRRAVAHAAARVDVSGTPVLYHGTPLHNLSGVLAHGLSPNRGFSPHMTTTTNAVFFTDSMETALSYATPHGVILEINTADLDLHPDYDDAGPAINDALAGLKAQTGVSLTVGEEVPEDLVEAVVDYLNDMSEGQDGGAEFPVLTMAWEGETPTLVAEPYASIPINGDAYQDAAELYLDDPNITRDAWGGTLYWARQFLCHCAVPVERVVRVLVPDELFQAAGGKAPSGGYTGVTDYQTIEGEGEEASFGHRRMARLSLTEARELFGRGRPTEEPAGASPGFADEGLVGGHWGSRGSGILFFAGEGAETKVLLVKRAPTTQAPNVWSVPGGAIPRTAQGVYKEAFASAVTEAMEEVGVSSVRSPVDSVFWKNGDFEYTTFLVFTAPFTPRLQWEHVDSRWVPLRDVEKLDLHPGLRAVWPELRRKVLADGGGHAASRSSAAGTGELWYHLTNKAKFKLDPKFAPQDNTVAVEDRSGRPGVYLGKDPEVWLNGKGYWRPFVVEVLVDSSVMQDPGVHGRYAGELFVPASSFGKLSVQRVIPLDAYAREKFGGYGWIEEETGTAFDTKAPLGSAEERRKRRFSNYRYPGPDVRDMAANDTRWLADQLRRAKS